MTASALPAARGARLSRSGVGFALLAYLAWGVTPIYWKQLSHVDAVEVIAHRVLWTLLFAIGLLTLLRRRSEAEVAVAQGRQRWLLVVSALILGFNWWIFVWAVNNDRIIDTSLGYYLTPLLNVGLGMLVFGERLSRGQLVAVALAVLGVANLTWELGRLPLISLGLGISFAIYGVVRKWVVTSSAGGLMFETGVLALPAAAFLLQRELAGTGALSDLLVWPPRLLLWHVGGGVVTALPLLCFASAARRLPLSAVGLFQYLAPSIALGVAIVLYDEPFTRAHAVTFCAIWLGLAIFSWEGFSRRSLFAR